MNRVVASRLIAVAILLASCGGDGDGGTTVVLGDADSGSEVSLEVGDRVDIELEANQTTGYRWEPAPFPDGLRLASSEFVEPGGSLVGTPGTQRFVVDVVGTGDGILRFEYVRPFDDPVVAERIVEFVLTITE